MATKLADALQGAFETDFTHAFRHRHQPEQRAAAYVLLRLLKAHREVDESGGRSQYVVDETINGVLVFRGRCRCDRRAFKLAKRRLKKKPVASGARTVRVWRREKMLREWRFAPERGGNDER